MYVYDAMAGLHREMLHEDMAIEGVVTIALILSVTLGCLLSLGILVFLTKVLQRALVIDWQVLHLRNKTAHNSARMQMRNEALLLSSSDVCTSCGDWQSRQSSRLVVLRKQGCKDPMRVMQEEQQNGDEDMQPPPKNPWLSIIY